MSAAISTHGDCEYCRLTLRNTALTICSWKSFEHWFDHHSLVGTFIVLGIAAALLTLWCCYISLCTPYLYDRAAKRRAGRKPYGAGEKETVVVTSPSGTTTSPEIIPTSTAAPATSDGKGTMGRRAEEGRGQVTFAPNPTTPAGAAPTTTEQVVVTSPAPAPADGKTQVAESTTPAPAPTTTVTETAAPVAVHDGTSDYQTAGMGSVRGRPRRN